MNNWERMNREMAYISDETIMENRRNAAGSCRD